MNAETPELRKGFWSTAPFRYIMNVLIGIDQLGNALFYGDPDETISSRIGKIKRSHGGNIPWKHPLAKLIDSGLEKVQPDHCINAIEEDEGADAIIKDK